MEHGMTEHGTLAERRINARITKYHWNTKHPRNDGTKPGQWNTAGTIEIPWNSGALR